MLLAMAPACQAAGDDPGFRGQVAVNWVLVPVVVRGPQGYVTGLRQEQFHLYADGRAVPIASFETDDDAPVSLIYLQDLSGSIANGGKLEASRAALDCLLARLTTATAVAPAELTLATFSGDQVELPVPLATNPDSLRAAAAEWQPRGTTALHDAVAELPRLQAQLGHYKQAAVLVTDGEDNASLVLPALARELVRRARLPVYVLGLHGGPPRRTLPSTTNAAAPADLLYLLSAETGGHYYPVASTTEATAACAQIASDLRHQYVLGFPAAEGTSNYHPLRIELRDRGYRQLTFRRGYTGGAPQAWSSGGS